MVDVTVSDASWRNEGFAEENKGRLFCFFYEKPVKNAFKSAQEERPVFEPRVFIKMLIPGDPLMNKDTYATERDKEAYPVEYERFRQKKSNTPAGCPIESWGQLSESQVMEFKALNIFTVEQFANLNDAAGMRIMGFNEMRLKARAFVNAHEAAENYERIKAEQDKKDAEMQALKDQIARLEAMMSAAAAPKPKGKGGRPKKIREPVQEAA